MESKLERTRRMSKELKKCLEFMKTSNSFGSIQTSIQSHRVTSRDRLSQTQKSDISLPLLSLSQRRNACKQLKIDSFKNIKKLEVLAIKEDMYEQVATPKLEKLRIKPQKAERPPNTVRDYLPASSNHQFEQTAANETKGNQTVSEPVGHGNPFKRMYDRLVEKSKQAAASPSQLKKLVILPRVSQITLIKQSRKSIRAALPVKAPQGQPLPRR
jgi:hypothetical protein